MRARTVSQWWMAAFLCLTLVGPTMFVVNKEAGLFVSFLGLVYLAVSAILSAVHLWHMDRRWKARFGWDRRLF
jgi:hypothetical protein